MPGYYITQLINKVDIQFEYGGGVEEFDAVIGLDGIFGNIRKHVLRDAVPETCAASPAAYWGCMDVVPYEEAKAKLGEEYLLRAGPTVRLDR